ncbi:tyrosine-protein phosphatase [Neobacillus terrae]|uniref:tyrosine-protein phosphatase n=1 Tax=Neobacillus terrae TaxID=3034837 RepID=UPI00140CD17B|nr:CpsB/CapC family capsule biosynthesis tyrosine phosphatase [Neobacillus terrae]NHM30019.1 tyrosine protein phosphatase [Neobacillus terrae]
MIDIHSHILPGIDDGSKNMGESLMMAREAVKEGISTIIATPHHKNGKYENYKSDIINKVNELNKVLENENVDLEVLPGQETRIYGEIVEGIKNDEILSLSGSQYLFVEFPSSHVPKYTEQLFFDIQMKGYIPVIVHPERNQEIIERPDRLFHLVEKGALTQVTASSLSGHFGKNIKNFSFQLIDSNLTHFIASDAHNVHNRTFKMEEAFNLVAKKYGIDMVYFFRENAELLVDNKSIFKEIPEKIKKKKLFGIF